MPQATMMKGTERYKINYAMAVSRKVKILRTPSRWTTEPEKDIPTNIISGIYKRWGKGHTRVLLLSNTVSSVHTAHQPYNQPDNLFLTMRIAEATLYRKPTR